jgi:hypothetical protein
MIICKYCSTTYEKGLCPNCLGVTAEPRVSNTQRSGLVHDMVSCPRCQQMEWAGIADSLAEYCRGCGFVRVQHGSGWVKGASMQEWAAYLHGAASENLSD